MTAQVARFRDGIPAAVAARSKFEFFRTLRDTFSAGPAPAVRAAGELGASRAFYRQHCAQSRIAAADIIHCPDLYTHLTAVLGVQTGAEGWSHPDVPRFMLSVLRGSSGLEGDELRAALRWCGMVYGMAARPEGVWPGRGFYGKASQAVSIVMTNAAGCARAAGAGVLAVSVNAVLLEPGSPAVQIAAAATTVTGGLPFEAVAARAVQIHAGGARLTIGEQEPCAS